MVTAYQYLTELFIYYVRCLPTVSNKHFFGSAFASMQIRGSSVLPQCGSGSREPTNADPSGSGSWSDLAVTKMAFFHEKYTLLI
jgi:hypothetical protein